MKLLVQVVVAGLCLGASGAQAQSFNYIDPALFSIYDGPDTLRGQPVNPSTTYITTLAPRPGQFLPNGSQLYGREFVRLSDVLTAASGGVSQGQLDAAIGGLSAQLVGIASRLDRMRDNFREGVALAGAINVLPPNPGDRFAVSFGGAGYEGAGAGSIAVSARLREDIIAYGAVARGPTQTLVKGGFGISFR